MRDIVRLDNVNFYYTAGRPVFKNATLSLAGGSFHYLTGASGAGKSSFLKLLYLAHRHFNGRVELFGRDIRTLSRQELPDYRARIGVVFQDFHLLPHLKVLDNVALAQRLQGFSWRESRERAVEILHWIGLGGHLEAEPHTLSGGQRQRVAIARAVVNRPNLILADEPTGNVDDETAVRLIYLFEELNRRGATVIIATHNRDLAHSFPHPEIRIEHKTLKIFNPSAAANDTMTAAQPLAPVEARHV
ncbi:MAG: cell division ATP-binding protein FtsE [Holosporales bacterium]